MQHPIASLSLLWSKFQSSLSGTGAIVPMASLLCPHLHMSLYTAEVILQSCNHIMSRLFSKCHWLLTPLGANAEVLRVDSQVYVHDLASVTSATSSTSILASCSLLFCLAGPFTHLPSSSLGAFTLAVPSTCKTFSPVIYQAHACPSLKPLLK